MTRIEITNDAEKDLIDIYLYGVEHFGTTQAENYLESIHARMSIAAENPSFGADYGFVQEGLRRLENQSHAIYFQPTTKGIKVLRILSGRVDEWTLVGIWFDVYCSSLPKLPRYQRTYILQNHKTRKARSSTQRSAA